MPNNMVDEERAELVRNVYRAFNKRENDGAIGFVVNKTAGVVITKLIDACNHVASYGDMPRNLAAEIIRLSGVESQQYAPCEDCCCYQDGVPVIGEDGERQMFAPGMRNYRGGDGSSYCAPCTCVAGQAIRKQLGWASQPAADKGW